MKSTTVLALALSATVSAQSFSSLTPIYPTEQPTDTVITVTQGSTIYTIPVWNPTTELTYGAPGTTLPTDGPDQPSVTISTSCTQSHSKSVSFSAPYSPSASTPKSSPSPSSTPASAASSSSSSAPSAPPAEQTTAAGYAMRPDLVGAIAGGLAAGLALV